MRGRRAKVGNKFAGKAIAQRPITAKVTSWRLSRRASEAPALSLRGFDLADASKVRRPGRVLGESARNGRVGFQPTSLTELRSIRGTSNFLIRRSSWEAAHKDMLRTLRVSFKGFFEIIYGTGTEWRATFANGARRCQARVDRGGLPSPVASVSQSGYEALPRNRW